MELHGQEPEVALLGALRGHLSSGAFVDVEASYTTRGKTDPRRLSCQIEEVSFE